MNATATAIPGGLDTIHIGSREANAKQANSVISNLKIQTIPVFTQNIVTPRSKAVQIEGDCFCTPISTFGSGDENVDRVEGFFRIKVSGDTGQDINNPNTGTNFRNEFARRILSNKDRDNE